MFKKIIPLTLLLLPIPLLADTIYTWGYGEMFYEILLGIAAFSNDDYLVKIAGGLGMLALMFKVLDGRSAPIMEVGKFFLLTVFVYVTFLTAGSGGVYRHVIEDRVTNYTNVVDGVPIGVGKTLALVTGLEYAIAEGMEGVFSTPHSTQYRNAGLGFPLVAHSNMAKMHSVDPFVQKSMDDYISNCLLYDMMDGTTDPNTIFNSGDLINDISSSSVSRMTNIYSAANPGGQLMTCSAASAALPAQVNGMIATAKEVVAAQSGLFTSGSTATFDTKAADIANLYFGVSKSSTNYMTQAVMMNMLGDGLNNVAKVSGIDPTALAYGTAMAERSAQSNFVVSGELAKKYLPLLKGILTMLIVGIAWILAVLAIIFFDPQYLRMYLSLMIFLSMWTPLAVMLNFITSLYLEKTLTPIGQVGAWYTMANKPIIDSEVMSTLAWLGYLGWSIPMLAYAIAKKSDHGFVALTSGLTGAMGSGSGQAAGEIARGNMNLGNVRIGKREAYAEGSSYAEDQHGARSNQAVSQDGRIFDSAATQFDGNLVNAQTSTATGSSAIATNGQLTAANFTGVNGTVSSAYKKGLGDSIERVSTEQEAAQSQIGTTMEAAITRANGTKDSAGSSASTGASLAEKTMIQKTFSKALDKVASESDGTFQKELSSMGIGAGVGGGAPIAADGMRKLLKGLQVSPKGEYSYKDDSGHEHKFSTDTSAKIHDSISKVSSNEIAHNQEYRDAFAHMKESSSTAMAGTKYSDGESLVQSYTKSTAEKESLQKMKEEGLNLSQDRKIAMMHEAIRGSMVEKEMDANGGDAKAAEAKVDGQLARQGKGKYTDEQIRQGINYVDTAILEANSGDASRLTNMMQNATRNDNPIQGEQMPNENGFKPVVPTVQSELDHAKRNAGKWEKESDKIEDKASETVPTEGKINGITGRVESGGKKIENSGVGHAGVDAQFKRVSAGKKEDEEDIKAGQLKAAAAAAASQIFNSTFGKDQYEDKDGKPKSVDGKEPTRTEKMQKAVEDAEHKKDEAKKNFDKQLGKSETTHAKERLSEIIDDKMDSIKDKSSKEYKQLAELKDDIAKGENVSRGQFEKLGIGSNELTESGVRFEKGGAIDMHETGSSVKRGVVAQAQGQLAEADVAHKVAKDTFDLHQSNPNIAPEEAKQTLWEKTKGHLMNAGEKIGLGERTLTGLNGLLKGGVAGAMLEGNIGNEVDPSDSQRYQADMRKFISENPTYNPKTQEIKSNLEADGWRFQIEDKKPRILGPK